MVKPDALVRLAGRRGRCKAFCRSVLKDFNRETGVREGYRAG
jgi:hypothetical protein